MPNANTVHPAPPEPSTPTASTAWHAQTPEQVLVAWRSTPLGLTQAEASQRLLSHGPNRLAEETPSSVWVRLARQFNNLLLYVLMAAALVTAFLGHWVDTGVIAAVVVLNAVIGFVQEGKAEAALQAIRHMLSPRAVVLRDGHPVDVAAADLVPGDVVQLASGDSLPADVRLLQARNLRLDEAALTGESVPVDKHTGVVDVHAALGDRLCMGYAGTLVAQGQARAVVVATGAQTEMGRIGRMLAEVEQGTTPLLRKMTAVGSTLTGVILAVAALLFVFGVWVRDMAAGDMFMAAVGLAVAAIPEGLPAIMTIALAIGVQRMATRHAIIRRLPAVETLGSVTVICSDKTGTLTRNEMTVQQIILDGQVLDVAGAGYAPEGGLTPPSCAHAALAPLAQAAALCNDAHLHQVNGHWVLAGDPTEGALLTLAMKAGCSPTDLQRERPRLDVVPFESEHRYMATLHTDTGGLGRVVLLKGAPERLLTMCSHQRAAHGEDVPLALDHWQQVVHAQARQGRRVLALAQRALPVGQLGIDHADVAQGMTLLGMVAIIDPPRAEAVQAVAQCQQAGIRVVMITGDHGVTASAIAAQLGMSGSAGATGAGDESHLKAVTGPEIEAMTDAALREAVRHTRVFARASPEHKIRLVRALQANGEIVAMTGDGVNDAPALKQADVGVAMGKKGTEAAKQAGAVVLADDNFASIAHAVEEGRTVYDNLKKTITFLLPINGGESLSLVLAVLLGVALPIAPAQILWINMVSSIALALVLAFEPTEADVMRRPPRRPDEPMLSTFVVWRITLVSLLFLAGIFGMHHWALSWGADESTARTVAVNTLVAMEVFYLFSVRYLKSPSFTWQGVKGTPVVLASVAAVVVLQVLFTYAPFMHVLFDSRPLTVATLLAVVGAGVAVLVVLELEKAVLRRLFGRLV
ncbi:MAG: carbonate dehydratase [Polaromonas sp.]|nr:carbonate dehydratase [Polaromonas sp.]